MEPVWERAGRKVAKDEPNCGMERQDSDSESEEHSHKRMTRKEMPSDGA